jgi:hypothetical protein
MRSAHRIIAGGMLVLGMSGMAFAGDNASETKALEAEIAAMRAELNSMKSGGSWMNDARRDEVKALVKEVLSDADTRASLQGTGATAGYNKNFFIASEDGKFLLQIGGRIQLRYVANIRQDQPGGANSAPAAHDIESGFEMRRIKPYFKGHIGSPKITYQITFAADRNTNAVGLEEAKLGYKWSDKLSFEGGRYKQLFAREENVSSGKQLAVERSVVNEAFNVGWVEGISATYTENAWRVAGGINDGARSGEIGGVGAPTGGAGGNYGFLAGTGGNAFFNDTNNVGMVGRADYKVFGDWKSWEDFSSWSGEEKSLFVGGGVMYTDSRINQNAGVGVNVDGVLPRNQDSVMWTGDVGYKANGLGLFASVYGRHGLSGGSPLGGVGAQGNPGAQYSDYGFMAQAGYFIVPDVMEPFIRYEYITFDVSRNEDPAAATFGNTAAGAGVNTVHDVNILTAGYNWYFKKHDAKFTLDVVWAIDSVNSAALGGNAGGTHSGAGLLPDRMVNSGVTAENQVAIRAQFQLQF